MPLSSVQKNELLELAKLIRYQILVSTTSAGSGHPTSSLSATDLMTTLFFGGYFRTDLDNPKNPENDRLVFSKGHASPLFYALYATAGKVSLEELKTLRKFDSILEGHPSVNFAYTEAPTGSLGQGLGLGLGMAISAQMDNLDFKTWVLMGDSEMAEGSVWEAIQLAGYRQTKNLIGIIDMNRLGQRGQTINGHQTQNLATQIATFGWHTIIIEDGHDLDKIDEAFAEAVKSELPVMLIAKTFKGAGISFLQDKEGWHGKALKPDELERALVELPNVNLELVGKVVVPS
jgi:transketolase